MVATRRGARTGATEDTAKSHRKKPIRKAATKSTTPAPPKPAPKSRITRARKAEGTTEDVQDEQKEEASEDTEELPKTRPVTTRTRKAATKATDVAATKSVVSKPPAKTTRTTNTRSKKTEVHHDEVPEIQLQPKPRATRTTRAKTAMEKAKVLSPKKVTQVSKGPLRATKASAAKVSSKPALPKPAASTRSTRQRAVSDENAEFPSFGKEMDRDGDEHEDEIAVVGSKQASLFKSRKAPVTEIASDTEMSSRPTTPTDSPKIDVSGTEEDLDETRHDANSQHDESDIDASSASEDELCGPKTPMRRCSPREAERYSNSPTRTVQHDHRAGHVQTPVRSNNIHARRRGTPQTQKPYIQPGVPALSREPMTTARATNRAMVFPELKPFTTSLEARSISSLTPQLGGDEEQIIELDGNSSDQSVGTHQQSGMNSMEDVDIARKPSFKNEQHPDDSESERFTNDESTGPDLYNVPLFNSPDHDIDEHMIGSAGEECHFGFDLTPHPRAENTGVERFEDDDSVIIASNRRAFEQASPENNLGTGLIEASAPTPKPETLIWENIRQDDTLVHELMQGEDTRDALPEPDQTEILSPTESLMSDEKMEQNTSGDSEVHRDLILSHDALGSAHKQSSPSVVNNRPSLDGTIHLSQFIDVESLSERRLDDTCQQSSGLGVDLDLGMNPDDFTHSTPARSSFHTGERNRIQVVVEPSTPRYARPTMSSAVKRRQSLPSLGLTMPIAAAMRPSTSDGASLPRLSLARPFHLFVTDDAFQSVMPATGPSQSQSIIMHERNADGSPTARSATPHARIPHPRTPSATTPRNKRQRGTIKLAPQTVAADRYPGQVSVSNKISWASPPKKASASSAIKAAPHATKERYPGLPSRTTYEALVEPPTARDVSSSVPRTPETDRSKRTILSPKRPSLNRTPMARSPIVQDAISPSSSRKERYPGLPSRRTYEEHAKTAVIPTRFRTVLHVPAKRPASAMKASSLSSLARRDAGNAGTPTKTPLKPPGMTPGQVPMTPHPAAPLRGVCALVDVWTNDASPASSAFIALLQRLGARTTKSWSKRLTHVVFKSGSPSTLQRVRLHNKEVQESGMGSQVFCVNSRWVTDCDTEGRHVDETDEEYAVDVEEACRGSKRRCKSMEPAALINLGGNIIRDRKSSLGRASLGRASLGRSPLKQAFTFDDHAGSPQSEFPDKENDDHHDDSSPVTPAYLAAPNLLIQQTAPMNRVRKLALGPKKQEKDRRTTLWNLEF